MGSLAPQDAWSPAAREPGEPLEVLVLTGFLGAGKTTLFNYLLSGLSGLRVAAVVNDFGSVEVDALSVAGKVDSTISLAGGCMCCEIDITEIDTALADLASPEHALDLVVIEASGLAEPEVLATLVRRQPRDLISYGGLINVIDGVHVRSTVERHPQLARHLTISDLLVLTKTDLLDAEALGEVREYVRKHAPRTPLTTAVKGRVDMRLLFGASAQPASTDHATTPGTIRADDPDRAQGGHADHGHEHIHDAYSSVVLDPPRPLHPRRFLSAVSDLPPGVFRAKGAVVLAAEDGDWTYDVSKVGGMLDVQSRGRSVPGDSTQLVVIGIDLPDGAADALDGAQVSDGEEVRPEDRLVLEPFIVAPESASDTEGWIFDDDRFTPVTGSATMLSDPEDPDSQDPANTP